MKRLALHTLCFALLSSQSLAGTYDFDYSDEENMRGAYYICLPSGFLLGDCDKVFEKCWQPPLLKIEFGTFGIKVTSVCLELPKLSVSDSEIHSAIGEGESRALIEQGISLLNDGLDSDIVSEAINPESEDKFGVWDHIADTAEDVIGYENQYNNKMREFEETHHRLESWYQQLEDIQYDYQISYDNGEIMSEWEVSEEVQFYSTFYNQQIEQELERLEQIQGELDSLTDVIVDNKIEEMQVRDGITDNRYMIQYDQHYQNGLQVE